MQFNTILDVISSRFLTTENRDVASYVSINRGMGDFLPCCESEWIRAIRKSLKYVLGVGTIMLIKKPADVTSSEITPKRAYLSRRAFMTGAAIAGGTLLAGRRLGSGTPLRRPPPRCCKEWTAHAAVRLLWHGRVARHAA